MNRILRRAAISPGVEVDLAITDGRIQSTQSSAISGGLGYGAHQVNDLEGRPVIPGLVDHHVHLLASAAALESVDTSPGALGATGGLTETLRSARRARPEGWLRCIGYDVGVCGDLDRQILDEIDVGPVRVQDRTGIMWILDSRGLGEVLPANRSQWPSGVVCDASTNATGVLVRLDVWLREQLQLANLGSNLGSNSNLVERLGNFGRWLASRGITAVTDAGANNTQDEISLFERADLAQHVTAMTRSADLSATAGRVNIGPVKVLLDDVDLPTLGDLTARISEAHMAGRAVAVHCVTDTQLALALACGVGRGDRIEHGSLIPAEYLPVLAESGVTIVVSPGLVHSRGDRYLSQLSSLDIPSLYRVKSLLDAGISIAGGTDSPYGPSDPWISIFAAASRRTSSGAVLGASEAIPIETALGLFAGSAQNPGNRAYFVPGAPADLVVLDSDWGSLSNLPLILATIIGGQEVFGALPST